MDHRERVSPRGDVEAVIGDLAGQVHGHAPADVMQWLDSAGFRVSRPATDVRAAGLQSWAAPHLPADVPLRVMQAAGRKPG